MHPVLQRQFRRVFGAEPEAAGPLEDRVAQLLRVVSTTYAEADHDRRLLENALEQTCAELVEQNRLLDAENQRLVSAEAALIQTARTDALTGLPNRAMILGELARRIGATRREPGHSFAVAFVDLDRFKTINDGRGHRVGDLVLREVGERLARSVRNCDMVARIGGDEFAVLLCHVGDHLAASASVARLARVIAEPMLIEGTRIQITASVGIAIHTQEVQDPDELLRNADIAMYRAKGAGRDRAMVFDDGMYTEEEARYRLGCDLREAAARGQLRLVYQPVYALGERRPIAFEALLRWRHPERGDIPPSEFIPLAEETGAIVEIGDWVVEDACRRLAAWKDHLPPGLYTTLNLSARQLVEPQIATRIGAAMERWSIAPERLGLELTETSVLTEGSPTDALGALRAAGIRLLVDDFGTGWSTLANLLRLDADVIKIDRIFLSNARGRSPDFLRGLLLLARAVGARTVVEGVETADELAMVEALGADAVQGYFLGRPMEPEQALGILRR